MESMVIISKNWWYDNIWELYLDCKHKGQTDRRTNIDKLSQKIGLIFGPTYNTYHLFCLEIKKEICLLVLSKDMYEYAKIIKDFWILLWIVDETIFVIK